MKIALILDSCFRLGIGYVSAVLKNSGHTVKGFADPQLFDEANFCFRRFAAIFDYKKQVVDRLKAYAPHLVGFSADSESYQWALTMARMIKKEMDVPIIFGGIHPTSVPERVIANDAVDMVCVGEGEYPMLELANSMAKGSIDYSIKNIWFKKDGRIIQNEIRPPIEDLDSLPFADHEIFQEESPHFGKGYWLMTDRGCPHACSYCFHSYFKTVYKAGGKYLRQRSVQNVIKELEMAKQRYEMNSVLFYNDCFGRDLEWLREFAPAYKKKIGVRFMCNMHPADVTSETMRYLKEAGCYYVTLGIQTLDEKANNYLFNRRLSNTTIENAMKMITGAGMQLGVENIFDYPGQDYEQLVHSLLLYVKARPTRVFFYQLKYYPSSLLTRKMKDAGLISSERWEELMDGKNINNNRFDTIVRRTESENNKRVKIQMLLYMLDWLPPSLVRFFIKKKIYQFFPGFLHPSHFLLMRIIFSRDLDTQIFWERTISRYLYLAKRAIFGKPRRGQG